MTHADADSNHAMPAWVLAICAGLALIEPVTHLALVRLDTGNQAFSGLHSYDSAIFLVCMDALENGFHSPYATCQAQAGPRSPAYFPTPFHWMYAVIGAVAHLFKIDPFLFLGLANGFFGFIYLVTAYHLLRVTVPRLATQGFVLFALGGGLGGVAYLTSWMAGAHDAPEFEAWFWRFLMYDLHEGPNLAPVLHMPRLYYTVSIALGLGGIAAFVQSIRMPCRRHWWYAAFLLFWSTVINVRFGGFAGAICAAYSLTQCASMRDRVRDLVAPAIALAGGLFVFAAMTLASPVLVDNSLVLVRETLWPTAFASAAFFYVIPVVWTVRERLSDLSYPAYTLTVGGMVYLALIVLFFLAHVVYYGSFWRGGDHTAIVRWSDMALIGACGAAIAARFRRTRTVEKPSEIDWFLIWTLGFLVFGFSAFGQGWGARLVPQRALAFLGLPMSVLATYALSQWKLTRPILSRAYFSAIVACGLASIGVASLFVQYPLGQQPGTGPFGALHAEHVTHEDAHLMDEMQSGYVLTPRTAADRIAIRPRLSVIGGYGAADLAEQPSIPLDAEVARFFGDSTEAERRETVGRWCIDYVYCPDSRPVPEETVNALRTYAWLEAVAQAGQGVVFRVRD